ncbi:MAG: dephospho-CoA kinase [Firmicutes bacterium]|nr:dephospho-CoA kinase [Bacillota bacterium]
MYRIGLTGGIATGKSTVSNILRRLGAYIIDADQIAREIVRPGCPAYHDIVRHFGPQVLLPDGQLNRPWLAQQIFNDSGQRQVLNQITHPRVIERIETIIGELAAGGYQLPVVLDIPLLIEAGMAASVDEVWLVVTDYETQLRRLMQRDGLTAADAKRRIEAQMPLSEKARYAHRLIDNAGSLQATEQIVRKFWLEAVERATKG